MIARLTPQNIIYKSWMTIHPHGIRRHPVTLEEAAALFPAWINKRLRRARIKNRPKLEEVTGGTVAWQHRNAKGVYEITTRRAESPDHPWWGIHYRHPDDAFPFRYWQTNAVLQTLDDGVLRLGLEVGFGIQAGYIGPRPEPPGHSVPGIVRSFLQQRDWQCRRGVQNLYNRVHDIEVGEGKALWERIRDPERRCPIVVCAPDLDGTLHIDVDALGKSLVGTATLYRTEDPVLLDELRDLAPEPYALRPGMVRVYRTNVNTQQPNDPKRHRFFTARDLERTGEAEVRDQLVRGIARRGLIADGSVAFTLADLDRHARQTRLRTMRGTIQRGKFEANQNLSAQNRELDAYNTLLEAESEEYLNENAALKSNLETLNEQYEFAREELQEQRANFDWQQTELQRMREEVDTLRQRASVLNQLDKLPDDPESVVRMIVLLHSDKLFFTSQAWNSIRAMSFPKMTKLWHCLHCMATDLHTMHFDKVKRSPSTFERDYRALTTYELSLTDNKMTKQNKRAQRERTDHYKGKEIHLGAHIKIGVRKPDLLRVHYYPDHEDELLVIGHCGDHLETAGTARKK